MYNISSLMQKYRIVVPTIQRDYAYGREEEKDKREGLLNAIFDVLQKKESIKRLNYIYGVSKGNREIVLIDGQQRTTTLYLMRLYLTVNAGKDLTGFNQLSYATRTTSKDFCKYIFEHKEILRYSASGYRSIQDKLDNDKLFFKKWRNDPTVSSIICVLNAIDCKVHQLIKQGENIDFNEWLSNLENVKFEFVLLEGFKREEDLYTAMNGRGKQLTQFENLKPSICEYLKPVCPNIEDSINNEWIPAFWNYAKAVSPVQTDCDTFAVENHDRYLCNFFRYVSTMIWIENNKLEKGQKIDINSVLIWLKNADEKDKRFVSYAMCCFNSWFVDSSSTSYYSFDRDIQIKNKDDASGKTNIFWENISLDFVNDCCKTDELESINLVERIMLWAFIVYKWNESNNDTNGRSLKDYYVLMRDIYAASWDTHTPTSITKNPTEHLVAEGIMAFRQIVDGKKNNKFQKQQNTFNALNNEKYLILNNKLTSGCSDNIYQIVQQDSFTMWEAKQFADNLNFLIDCFGIDLYQAVADLSGKEYFVCYGSRSDRLYIPYTAKMLQSLFSMTNWAREDWYNDFLRKMCSRAAIISKKNYAPNEWKYYLEKYNPEFTNLNILAAFDFSIDANNRVNWFEIKSVYGLKATSRQITSPFILAAYRKKNGIIEDTKFKNQITECQRLIETRQLEFAIVGTDVFLKDNTNESSFSISQNIDIVEEIAKFI